MRWLLVSWAAISVLSAEKVAFDRLTDVVLDRRLEAVQKLNPDRKIAMQEMFTEAGCSGESLREDRVKGSKLPNLVCILPGSSEEILLVGAHYDKVKDGEGAIDNWTGASLLASLYQSHKAYPHRHTIWFVAFTDEEAGLVGSKAFVKQMPREELTRLKAFVNIDSVGAGSLKVWGKRAHRPFTNLAAVVAKSLQIEISVMDVDAVGDSDSHPFVDKKVPVIDFHSLDQKSWRLLHTDKDVLSAVDRERYRETDRFLAVFVGILDQRMEKLAGGG
jgi:acetylornithine deacetylase/succinyl-diaminopimelate desuccinylase-like protein